VSHTSSGAVTSCVVSFHPNPESILTDSKCHIYARKLSKLIDILNHGLFLLQCSLILPFSNFIRHIWLGRCNLQFWAEEKSTLFHVKEMEGLEGNNSRCRFKSRAQVWSGSPQRLLKNQGGGEVEKGGTTLHYYIWNSLGTSLRDPCDAAANRWGRVAFYFTERFRR